MNSILNSISSGDLQVQNVPREIPVKEDSIIELLQSSEIEFEIQQNTQEEPQKPIFVFEEEIEYKEPVIKEESVSDLLENSEIELNTCPEIVDKLQNINTGFGENQDLHFEDKCKLPELKKPLYQENYLNEFVTEEEKAAARHALGLYNKNDVVAMSLLTAEEKLPSNQELLNAVIKQLKQGDVFFTPVTQIRAVFDLEGNSLDTHLNEIRSLLTQQQKEILEITAISKEKSITSLGDVRVFLQGFNNGDNLHNTLNSMNQEMLRFEKTGQITQNNNI